VKTQPGALLRLSQPCGESWALVLAGRRRRRIKVSGAHRRSIDAIRIQQAARFPRLQRLL